MLLSVLALAAALAGPPAADGRGGPQVRPGDQITLYLNKVGPYHNPQRPTTTLRCRSVRQRPGSRHRLRAVCRRSTLGLARCLRGTGLSTAVWPFGSRRRRIISIYARSCSRKTRPTFLSMPFYTTIGIKCTSTTCLCGAWWERFTTTRRCPQSTLQRPRAMRMLGVLQEVDTFKLYVYTHKHISVAYNGNRIIEVNLTSQHPELIKPGATLDFTYDILWQPTTKPFETRFERYLDYSFFEHQIHWFSIFNSFMMVIFSCWDRRRHSDSDASQ